MTGPEPTYAGRVGYLATKHGKQAQIAPALATVGLTVRSVAVDTDAFGTFSGDVPRRGSPLEVVERKARAAMAATGHEIGLASEGSFGPHPGATWLTVDEELVALVDDGLDLVLVEREVSLETAAAATRVAPGDDLSQFCRSVGFPAQALVVRPADGPPGEAITKGITGEGPLARAVRSAAAASVDARALVETDLRAHLCPSRRAVIERAAARLAERLGRRCRRCSSPGWGLLRSVTGLPCERCGGPSELARAEVDGCTRCDHSVERPVVPPTARAPAAECHWCNP